MDHKLTGPRHRLQTLGKLKLVDCDGIDDPSLSARPRKLAVLAWLALRPGRRASRDQLVGMFWGERDDERARNSLSDALSHIRRVLGRDAVRGVADDVAVTDAAALDVDAAELMSAAASRNHVRVVALYAGAFLDGVYIDNAPDFSDWRDRERTRLAALFAQSASERCATLARGSHWTECWQLAERWLEAEPASAKAAEFLLNAINAPATHESRAAALVAYDAIVRRLDHQMGVPPHDTVTLLARDIKSQLLAESSTFDVVAAARSLSGNVTPLRATPAITPEPVPVVDATPNRTVSPDEQTARVASPDVSGTVRTRRGWFGAPYAAGLILLIGLVFVAWRSAKPDLDQHRVVIAEFEDRTADSTLRLLGRIAADRIGLYLTTNQIVDVVDPGGVLYGRTIDVRTIGRNAGAGLVVRGSYSVQGDSVSVQARIVSARDGHVLQSVVAATASRLNPDPALQLISERVAGALASQLDMVITRLAREASQPTTYEVYLAYVEGLDLFSHKQYKEAIPAFLRAATLDTTFVSARIWLVAAYGNAGDMPRADSTAKAVAATNQHLLPVERALLDYWLANINGNRQKQYDAGQRMLRGAPNSDLTLFMVGFAAINVNRPLEAVRLLQRIPVKDSSVSWNVYGTRLSFALHMVGRFDDELIEARRRRAAVPRLIQAIAEEARALAALGRISDADRAITDAAALPGYQSRSVGSAMYYTGLEMRVHGHEAAARGMFARTIDWALHRTADEPGSEDAHRMLALAYYSLENWQAADSLFRIQLAATPRNIATMGLVGVSAAHCGDKTRARLISDALTTVNVPYSRGVNTMWRARIAAVLDQKDETIRLMRQAINEGAIIDDIHIWPEFLSLHGYAPYEALVKLMG